MKDLNKIIEESKANDSKDSNEQQRTPGKVQNPNFANEDNNNDLDDDKVKDSVKNTPKSVDDFANDIVSKLFK